MSASQVKESAPVAVEWSIGNAPGSSSPRATRIQEALQRAQAVVTEDGQTPHACPSVGDTSAVPRHAWVRAQGAQGARGAGALVHHTGEVPGPALLIGAGAACEHYDRDKRPRQVQVRVCAVALVDHYMECNTCVDCRAAVTCALVGGHYFAGEVTALVDGDGRVLSEPGASTPGCVGATGDALTVGARVCGAVAGGAWASVVHADARLLAPLPEDVSYEQGAARAAALPAARALPTLGTSDVVLVQDATGAGQPLLAMALCAGAEVIAVVNSTRQQQALLRRYPSLHINQVIVRTELGRLPVRLAASWLDALAARSKTLARQQDVYARAADTQGPSLVRKDRAQAALQPLSAADRVATVAVPAAHAVLRVCADLCTPLYTLAARALMRRQRETADALYMLDRAFAALTAKRRGRSACEFASGSAGAGAGAGASAAGTWPAAAPAHTGIGTGIGSGNGSGNGNAAPGLIGTAPAGPPVAAREVAAVRSITVACVPADGPLLHAAAKRLAPRATVLVPAPVDASSAAALLSRLAHVPADALAARLDAADALGLTVARAQVRVCSAVDLCATPAWPREVAAAWARVAALPAGAVRAGKTARWEELPAAVEAMSRGEGGGVGVPVARLE